MPGKDSFAYTMGCLRHIRDSYFDLCEGFPSSALRELCSESEPLRICDERFVTCK